MRERLRGLFRASSTLQARAVKFPFIFRYEARGVVTCVNHDRLWLRFDFLFGGFGQAPPAEDRWILTVDVTQQLKDVVPSKLHRDVECRVALERIKRLAVCAIASSSGARRGGKRKTRVLRSQHECSARAGANVQLLGELFDWQNRFHGRQEYSNFPLKFLFEFRATKRPSHDWHCVTRNDFKVNPKSVIASYEKIPWRKTFVAQCNFSSRSHTPFSPLLQFLYQRARGRHRKGNKFSFRFGTHWYLRQRCLRRETCRQYFTELFFTIRRSRVNFTVY